MIADGDCLGSAATGTIPATLPRSFRPSSLLRRRLAEEPASNSGLRLSMPVGDSVDFLDFSAFVTNGIGQTAEDNMLQALLSSLPEPPGFAGPKDLLLKPLNGSTMPGSAFGQSVALATPAPSRRNTDEVDLPLHHHCARQPSIESLASTTSVSSVGTLELAEEMPPVSPFFARVSFADIDSARDTARRASLSRSRSRSRSRSFLADSYERHAASWCAPAPAPTSASANKPGRMSLAEVTRALSEIRADELLINQQPPPRLLAGVAESRWFRVSVYGLLTSQTARVAVSEVGAPSTPVDASDPALRHALRRYPLVLALCGRQKQQEQGAPLASRLRVPSRRTAGARVPETPTLSFTVGTRGASDRPVRSVDVEAMAAAHLPPAHSRFPAAADAQCLRTPSQSSTATLADSLRSEPPAEPAARAAVARTLLRRPQRRSGAMDSGLPTPRQLRASASMPPAPSRRRSEVQALITQANAVLRGGRAASPEPRPPRASFPLYSAPSLALLRAPGPAPTGLRTPTALSPSLAAALSRQQHRLEPVRGGHSLRHSVSSGELAGLAPPPRSLRGPTPLGAIRPPPPVARSSQPALSRRATPLSAHAPRTPGPLAAQSRLRHSGPSTATLRQAFHSGGSEERPALPRRLTSGPIMRTGMHALFGSAGGDEGFLTLRPVHTPDLVPRTIDPRLIERAMTPMLKTNIGIQYSSLVDLVRSAAANADADPDADADADPDADPDADDSEHLPTLTEVPPAAEMPQSKLSPISSPEHSPLVPGAKPAKPGFLARYRSSKLSSAPLPVSAIPLPPPVVPTKSVGALQSLGLSNIPTLRKARSLWAMRSSSQK
ncbi:hypothetical protein IW152_003820 [Coemansia sp. BCRC 34962]|nr:hypothetical protein IW152_003820 [Coemansia sp. BCRC 34962]